MHPTQGKYQKNIDSILNFSHRISSQTNYRVQYRMEVCVHFAILKQIFKITASNKLVLECSNATVAICRSSF